MADYSEIELRALVAILEQVYAKTTCPDPAEGGCIGGPIPGYGCVHEAVGHVIRRMKVLAEKPNRRPIIRRTRTIVIKAKKKCPECDDTGEVSDGWKMYPCECAAGRQIEEAQRRRAGR